MTGEIAKSEDRRLKGWKQIGAFLGCDSRTARRWEEARALPVHRYPSGGRSAVYAYDSELKDWLAQAPPQRGVAPAAQAAVRWPLDRWRAALLATIAVALAFAVGLLARGLHFSSPRTPLRHVSDSQAEALYRDGLYNWQTRTPIGLTRAIADFNRAIARDPKYAEAYAGLATCYDLIREYTTAPPSVAFPRAIAAARRAIVLEPSLGEAHLALAFAMFYWLRDTAGADREFHRAISLSPRYATAHHWYATFLMTVGKTAAALREIDTAQRLDPESSAILADKGVVLSSAGQWAAATELLRHLEQTQPLFASPHQYLAMIYRQRGDDGGFLRELAESATLRKDAVDAALAAAGSKGLATGGHVGMLRAMLGEQQQLIAQGLGTQYFLARTYAALGENREAMQSLKESVARRETSALSFPREPDFARFRRRPEFRALVAEAGLAGTLAAASREAAARAD